MPYIMVILSNYLICTKYFFVEAAHNEDLDMLKYLVKRGGNVNLLGKSKRTPLMEGIFIIIMLYLIINQYEFSG